MSKDYCNCTGREDELKEALDALKVGFSLVVHGKPGIGKSAFLEALEKEAEKKWCTYAFEGLQRGHFIDAARSLGCNTSKDDTIATLINKIAEGIEICERFVFFCDDATPEKAVLLVKNINAQFVFAFNDDAIEEVKQQKELAACYFLELKHLSREAMHEIALQYTNNEDRIGKAVAESYGNPFSLITALDETKKQVVVREEYDVTIFVVLFFVSVLAYRFISLASRDVIGYAFAGSIWALYYLVRFIQYSQRGK